MLSQKVSSSRMLVKVSKEQVNNLDISYSKALIETLMEEPKKYKRSLVFLFPEHNETEAEVFEVPEIRKYIENIFEAFPQILYFLSDIDNHDQTILACIGDTGKCSINGVDGYALEVNIERAKAQHILNATMEYTKAIKESQYEIQLIKDRVFLLFNYKD